MIEEPRLSSTKITPDPSHGGGQGLYVSAFATNQLTVGRRAILVLIASLAAYIGVMPATVFLDRPLWAYAFWLVVLVISAFEVRRYESVSTEDPSGLDYIAAFLSSLYPAVIIGILWLMSYWMFFAVDFLIRGALHLIGKKPIYSPDTFAFVPSVGVALLMTLALPETILRPMRKFLYPNAAGVQPEFRKLPLARQKQLLRASVFVLCLGIVLGLLNVALPTRWFHILYAFLLILVLIVSASMWESGLRGVVETEETAAGIVLLLQSLGFQVLHRVVTGDREADPLLVELDLVAWRGSIAFAVKLKLPSDGAVGPAAQPKSVGWEVGPVVLAATSMLKRTVQPEITHVVPMLILADLVADSDLMEFADEEKIVLWDCSAQVLRNIRRASPTEIASQAESYGLAALVNQSEREPDRKWRRTRSQCEAAVAREQGPERRSRDIQERAPGPQGAGA